jgi:arginine repressor
MSTLPLFDGRTYDAARDGQRLKSQLEAVRQVLSAGEWKTLNGISRELHIRGIDASEASISARIRDLRKAKFGAYQVGRRYIDNGLWAYRMEVIS